MGNRTCSVDGCERKHAARGYCKKHYYAKRNSGELVIPGSRECEVYKCSRPVESRGLCQMHINRVYRYGTTQLPTRERDFPQCSVEGCGKTIKGGGRGYCPMHYQRLRVYGSTDLPKREPKRCKVEGCDRKYRCSGYCEMHYSRVREFGYEGPVGRVQREPQECETEGCHRRAKHYGLCPVHHHREQRAQQVARDPENRIQNVATNEERLRRIGWAERVVVPELGPCWEWAGLRDKRGYGRISVQGRKMRSAHRIAYQSWVGDLTSDQHVCHKCDNPPCMNPEHLFAGDHLANMRDAVSKKRHAYGERQGHHKLTEQQVREIRARYIPRRVSYAALGVEYGVSATAIRLAVIGRNWKHVA